MFRPQLVLAGELLAVWADLFAWHGDGAVIGAMAAFTAWVVVMAAPGSLQQVGVISPPVKATLTRTGIKFPIDSTVAPVVLVVYAPAGVTR